MYYVLIVVVIVKWFFNYGEPASLARIVLRNVGGVMPSPTLHSIFVILHAIY